MKNDKPFLNEILRLLLETLYKLDRLSVKYFKNDASNNLLKGVFE